jgi:hypothetical protein
LEGRVGSFACFGCAMGLRGKQMCQQDGLRRRIFFKNANGRLYYFLTCSTFIFFKVQVVTEPLPCPRGKSLLGSRQPFCLKTKLSRPYGWQRFVAWRSSGFLPQMFIRSTHFKYSKNVSTKHDNRHYAKPLLAAVFIFLVLSSLNVVNEFCLRFTQVLPSFFRFKFLRIVI